MGFNLPEFIEIQCRARRSFVSGFLIQTMLGELVVYYHGHTSAVLEPDEGIDLVAVDLLRELIREHMVDIDSIPEDLSANMRSAALEYVNDFEDTARIRALLDSFGPVTMNSDTYRQIAWLCPECNPACDSLLENRYVVTMNWRKIHSTLQRELIEGDQSIGLARSAHKFS